MGELGNVAKKDLTIQPRHTLTGQITAAWFPIVGTASLLITVGTLTAQLSSTKAELDEIKSYRPAVMQEQIRQIMADVQYIRTHDHEPK